MTQLEENLLMLTATISGFPGKTIKELINIPDCWLNNYSEYGVDLWASFAERKGYIRSKKNKNNEYIYYAQRLGVKEYKKYNPD